MLNKAQLAKVQAAAKELRKMYCKKVMEKLCVMMKATLKRLAKHFQVMGRHNDSNDHGDTDGDDGGNKEEGDGGDGDGKG